MAQQRVEELIVCSTWAGASSSGVSGYSGDANTGAYTAGTSATKLDTFSDLALGEIAVVDPILQIGLLFPLPAAAIGAQFAYYHPTLGVRLTDTILKGTVKRYGLTAYAANTPKAFKIVPGAAPVVGDEVELTLSYKSEYDWQPLKVIVRYKFASTVINDELVALAAKVNAIVAQNYHVMGKVSCITVGAGNAYDVATATGIVFVGNPIQTDYSKQLIQNNVIFDVYLSQAFDQSANIEDEGWSLLFPAVTKTEGSVTGGTFNGDIYTAGSFSTADSIEGHGSATQIRSKEYKNSFPFAGSQNRVEYPFVPYDPVVDTDTYDQFTIDYDETTPSVGQPSKVSMPKKLTIAIKVGGTNAAALKTYLADVANALR